MKKFLLLLGTLFCAFNLSAQNYDGFLQSAYTALKEGKIKIAQSSYNIYKKMTGRNDLDFETLLKDKSENDWKNNCFIVDMGNGYCIAGLKDLKNLYYDDAVQNCKYCRYGGFTDWRLPKKEEILMMLDYIPWKESFWADKKFVVSKNGYIKTDRGIWANDHYFFPVRIFKKE